MRRMDALRACGAALLVVSLAGCVKMDMQLEINTDDTVDGDIVVAFDRSISDMAESMGEDPSAMFDDMETDLPENAEVEDYEDDEFIGKRYIIDGADLSEFAEDEGGFGIVHEGDEFVVNGEMDMSQMDPSQMGDMGQLEGQLGSDFDPEAMMESFDVSLSITFPGEVIEHNGELDGTTVTWTPQPGENLEISARSEESGAGGLPVWVWFLIAAVVVAALAALLFFMSRSRGRGEATADGSEAAAGSEPPPPPAGMAANTGETQASAAEASASQVVDGADQPEHQHGTPLGAEEAERPSGDAGSTRPLDVPADDAPVSDTSADESAGDATSADAPDEGDDRR